MPGPVPNRSGDLSRERDAKRGDKPPIKTGVLREVIVPRYQPEWDWHPLAKRMWDGMKTSGQADYFQDSDWAFALSLMDDLSAYKKSKNRSAVMLATILSAMERLLITEADRRRARIELEAPEDTGTDAALFAIEGYKDALGAT